MDVGLLQGWTGRTAEAEDVLTPRLVAEYHATFDPCLAPGPDAPPGLHWCLAPPIAPAAELGPDGHPAKGGFLPPVPLPRRMWAGGEVVSHAPLRPGDTVTRRSRIGEVTVKQGRSGALCFVAVHHDYHTARGLAVSERHDIVYRDASGSPAAGQPVEPRPAELAWTVAATPVLLFRYSAMTFNGHRIHYDLPYVTGEEGYAGLVVHGPIQATLLLNLAATLLGGVPTRFRYRGLSPLIAGGAFRVAGNRGPGGTVECWTAAADGRVCMQAAAGP